VPQKTAAPKEAFMNITRRTLLGTIAAGFTAIPAFEASAQSDWSASTRVAQSKWLACAQQ